MRFNQNARPKCLYTFISYTFLLCSFFLIQNVYADTVHYFYDEDGNLKYHTQMDLTLDDKGVKTASQKCLSDIEPVVYPDRSTSDPYDEMTCSPDGYASPPNAYSSSYSCKLQCENGDTVFDILPISPQKMICGNDETPQFIDGAWICQNPCLDLLDSTVEDFYAAGETINAYRCYSGDYCFAEADQVDGSTCTVEEGIDGCLVNYRYTGERCFPPEPEPGDTPPPEPEDPPEPEPKDPPPCLADQVKVWDANGNSFCVSDTNILDLDTGGTDTGGTDTGGTDTGGTDTGGTDTGGTDAGGGSGDCTTTLCPGGGDTDSENTSTVTGGGDCKSKPTCTGFIAVDCATLHQQWETRCAIEKLGSSGGNSTVTGDVLNCDEQVNCSSKNAVECKSLKIQRKEYCNNPLNNTPSASEVEQELDSLGYSKDYGDENNDGRYDGFENSDTDINSIVDINSILNVSPRYGSSCPESPNFNISGQQMTLNFLPLCDWADFIRPVLILLGHILSIYIIMSTFGIFKR